MQRIWRIDSKDETDALATTSKSRTNGLESGWSQSARSVRSVRLSSERVAKAIPGRASAVNVALGLYANDQRPAAPTLRIDSGYTRDGPLAAARKDHLDVDRGLRREPDVHRHHVLRVVT